MDNLPNIIESPLAVLKKRVVEYVEKCKTAVELEAQLKSLQKEIEAYKTKTIPDLMDEVGTTIIGVADNTIVSIDSIIHAQFPKNPVARERVAQNLINENYGGTVKRVITIELEKGNKELEENLLNILKRSHNEAGGRYWVTVDYNVHHSTYSATMKELYSKGTSIDPKEMGVYLQNVASIKIGEKDVKFKRVRKDKFLEEDENNDI